MSDQEDRLPPAPTASTSKAFEWSCKCLNVTLSGLDPGEVKGSGGDDKGKKKRVWLSNEGEKIVHPVYVGYKPSASGNDRTSRRCYVCSTKTYLPLDFSRPKDPYVGWVEVDLMGVLVGDELEAARKKPTLPLSDLLLNLPTPSTFGKPPPTIPTTSATSTSQAIVSLLPPMPDPFFLPPPFVPAHPHLHSLILHALDQLKTSRARLENDVTTYVEAKTKEMQQEEDRIRGEVEHLWNAYQKGPGKKEKEKDTKPATRRGSAVHEPENVDQKVQQQPTRSVVQAPTSGLLGASLSANSFHAPPPNAGSYTTDELPELDITSPSFGSGSIDDRNMAVSLMVSHLEQQKLGNAPPERVRPGRNSSKSRRSVSRERPPAVNTVQEEDETAEVNDSWIGLEKEQAAKAVEGGRTPRPTDSKELKSDKPKTVKFQEPTKPPSETDGDIAIETASTDADDQVFDFEEHDKPETVPAKADDPDSRARSELDNKLSSTLAVDMPSHRSAWRRIEQSQSIYDSFRNRPEGDARRRDADSDSDSSDTEATPKNPSMFATSMPVQIALPKRAGQRKPEESNLERKTSLTERPGLLVPGLLAAMREKPARGNSLGLNVPDLEAEPTPTERQNTRTSSTSRDRSGSVSGTFKQDPGAVFEALADDEENDEVGDIDDASTRPGRPNFVPPHIQSLQDDIADSLVGWRSLAT